MTARVPRFFESGGGVEGGRVWNTNLNKKGPIRFIIFYLSAGNKVNLRLINFRVILQCSILRTSV